MLDSKLTRTEWNRKKKNNQAVLTRANLPVTREVLVVSVLVAEQVKIIYCEWRVHAEGKPS